MANVHYLPTVIIDSPIMIFSMFDKNSGTIKYRKIENTYVSSHNNNIADVAAIAKISIVDTKRIGFIWLILAK